jgi:hypothetical protein
MGYVANALVVLIAICFTGYEWILVNVRSFPILPATRRQMRFVDSHAHVFFVPRWTVEATTVFRHRNQEEILRYDHNYKRLHTRIDQQQLSHDDQEEFKKLSGRVDKDVGRYDPSERLGGKEINVGDPQLKLQEKEFSVTSILKELAAIQQQGPQKYCILGTRHCSFLHQQIIELL